MTLQQVTATLVLFGAGLLIYSLIPTNDIVREQSVHEHRSGWQILFILIGLFIIGYLIFVWILMTRDVSYLASFLAIILFGGSVFVTVVTRMSLYSIRNIQHVAALERHNATHDLLTNLPNRLMLYERINQTVRDAKRNQSTLAILLMDLNQFKEVNDTLGHHCGDGLLQQVAPRINSVLRDNDTLARLGGDEFAVILPATDLNGAVVLSKKVNAVMDQPFIVEGHSLQVGISIGISMYPEDAYNSDSLLRKADVAMYVAKRYSLGYSIYDSRQDQHTINRLMIIGKLHDAINNNELLLHYQPIMDTQTFKLWGFEALVRWEQPSLGLLKPDEFVPMAEQSEVIKEMTRWVLSNALRKFKQWYAEDNSLRISVNLSVKDIQDGCFANWLRGQFESIGIEPQCMNMEITESSMMTDSQLAQEVLQELHKMGVTFSIDDFGTGFSSLSYLKQLPSNSIKIDRSFVRDMLVDDNDAVIVRSTIDLAHNMGKSVIAEGVESQEVLDILEILGCDYVQGYFLCGPLAVDKVDEWMHQERSPVNLVQYKKRNSK